MFFAFRFSLSVQTVFTAHVSALAVYGYNHEADERQNERHIDGGHSEECALVDD